MTPKNLRVVRDHLRPIIDHQHEVVSIVNHTARVVFGEPAGGDGAPLPARIAALEALASASCWARVRWLLTGRLPS